eukprot:CAMPEP_0116880712 /NCGR_PEP_ID=MMETSP0463-20121206/12668_1 /TAXON_ID=181622 /ORGANISM="Strombidinopsis sp, Strain SopsisLIS2011" /LENGTH=53 /DNA_ID=CAMNT_0004531619 /DNA_START=322 /DNA_END=483 /DNA_ORIENTATION=+
MKESGSREKKLERVVVFNSGRTDLVMKVTGIIIKPMAEVDSFMPMVMYMKETG